MGDRHFVLQRHSCENACWIICVFERGPQCVLHSLSPAAAIHNSLSCGMSLKSFEKTGEGNMRPCILSLIAVTRMGWVGWGGGGGGWVSGWTSNRTQPSIGLARQTKNKQRVWRINSACVSEDCQTPLRDGQSGCSQSICRQAVGRWGSEPCRAEHRQYEEGVQSNICCCHARSA